MLEQGPFHCVCVGEWFLLAQMREGGRGRESTSLEQCACVCARVRAVTRIMGA